MLAKYVRKIKAPVCKYYNYCASHLRQLLEMSVMRGLEVRVIEIMPQTKATLKTVSELLCSTGNRAEDALS